MFPVLSESNKAQTKQPLHYEASMCTVQSLILWLQNSQCYVLNVPGIPWNEPCTTMWPLTSSITYHIMCPQSMAALIMQHSLYCVTHHHRFSMSFAWCLSRRWKRKCTFYILLVARILLDMYSIVLSCGCFEPKSQKYQVTLLSFFFYATTLCKLHYTLQTSFDFHFVFHIMTCTLRPNN